MSEPTPAQVRAWARAHGLEVADRGRLPVGVRAAYDAEHEAGPQVSTAAPRPAGAVPARVASPVRRTAPPRARAAAVRAAPDVSRPPRRPDGGRRAVAVEQAPPLSEPAPAAAEPGVPVEPAEPAAGRPRRRPLLLGGLLVGLAAVAAVAAVLVVQRPGPADEGTAVEVLQVGDCLGVGAADGTTVEQVRTVPCAGAHVGEVVAVFALPDGEYPGDERLAALARSGCQERVDTLTLRPSDSGYALTYYTSTAAGWKAGDRSVQCLVERDGLIGRVSPTTG